MILTQPPPTFLLDAEIIQSIFCYNIVRFFPLNNKGATAAPIQKKMLPEP